MEKFVDGQRYLIFDRPGCNIKYRPTFEFWILLDVKVDKEGGVLISDSIKSWSASEHQQEVWPWCQRHSTYAHCYTLLRLRNHLHPLSRPACLHAPIYGRCPPLRGIPPLSDQSLLSLWAQQRGKNRGGWCARAPKADTKCTRLHAVWVGE